MNSCDDMMLRWFEYIWIVYICSEHARAGGVDIIKQHVTFPNWPSSIAQGQSVEGVSDLDRIWCSESASTFCSTVDMKSPSSPLLRLRSCNVPYWFTASPSQNHVTRSEDESRLYSTPCCWTQGISRGVHQFLALVQAHLLHASQQGLGVHPRLYSQVSNEARTEVTLQGLGPQALDITLGDEGVDMSWLTEWNCYWYGYISKPFKKKLWNPRTNWFMDADHVTCCDP